MDHVTVSSVITWGLASQREREVISDSTCEKAGWATAELGDVSGL